jgi:outer membrane lipoprotein-sorting protein
MTLKRRAQLRWLLPLLMMAALMTAGSAVATISRSGHGALPARTAAQLLVDLQTAKTSHFSGTVVQSASLGLPDLPGIAGDQSSEFSSLVSGSHTLKVWSAGPQRVRVALLGRLGESDLVRNGSQVWVWSSRDNSARHLTVPAGRGEPGRGPAVTGEEPMTPAQVAASVLRALDPTTRVSTDPNAVVAGRSAYQLVLEPRDPATLIGSVRIAVDSATHLPMRVEVFARGAAKPGFEVGFTSFSAAMPPSSVFRFDPPPGAKVTEGMVGQPDPRHGAHAHGRAGDRPGDQAGDQASPRVVGRGWTAVVTGTIPGWVGGRPTTSTPGTGLGALAALVHRLPEASGSWGSGHLLRGTLFSVLVTDDGRVAAGAVAPERLYAALARP